MGQQHALVDAADLGLAIGAVELRLALQDDEGVVLIGVGMQLVLAARGIGLQHDPHGRRGGERNVGAALDGKLCLKPEELGLADADLGIERVVKILRAFWQHCGLGHPRLPFE